MNNNAQEQDWLQKEIDILQKIEVIEVENMMEAQRRFQELMQLDVQKQPL